MQHIHWSQKATLGSAWPLLPHTFPYRATCWRRVGSTQPSDEMARKGKPRPKGLLLCSDTQQCPLLGQFGMCSSGYSCIQDFNSALLELGVQQKLWAIQWF